MEAFHCSFIPPLRLYFLLQFLSSTSTLFNLGALDKIYPSVSYGLLYLTGSRTMYEPITPRMRRGVRESPFFQLTWNRTRHFLANYLPPIPSQICLNFHSLLNWLLLSLWSKSSPCPLEHLLLKAILLFLLHSMSYLTSLRHRNTFTGRLQETLTQTPEVPTRSRQGSVQVSSFYFI